MANSNLHKASVSKIMYRLKHSIFSRAHMDRLFKLILQQQLRRFYRSIEKLQATIENPSSPLEPPRTPKGKHISDAQRQSVHQRLNFHEGPGDSKMRDRENCNQHMIQMEDEHSYDERRNPRSRRQEESYYEAHSTRTTYVNSGGNRAERYSNAPIIIGRRFTKEVDLFPTLPNFKMPPCESYDGTGDLMEHLARFTSGMNLHVVPDQIMCRAFLITLKGAAHVWFQHLAPRSISCWAQLAKSFRSNFFTSRVQRKNSSTLFCIV
ncbi:hypothetical protein RJ639_007748 [Escallonia herrerae]|uniref:Retrotransposon gag domain-containing protein n=1 Tax=Escallonia herrerae TaxID=1293975 RepID=A0AA88W1T9_9ASTE|nr:hypothetical protein RJ639_007748 [Escallonia herrerae]